MQTMDGYLLHSQGGLRAWTPGEVKAYYYESTRYYFYTVKIPYTVVRAATRTPPLRSRNSANTALARTHNTRSSMNLAAQEQIPTVHSGNERESSLTLARR